MAQLSEITTRLYDIADLIKDNYAEKDYEDVILPFTLLRRLDCVLEPTFNDVQAAAEKYKAIPEETRARLLAQAAKQKFFNTSGFTLSSLLKSPDDIGENFRAYLNGFSQNIKEILYNFSGGEEKGLDPIYETLLRKKLLFKLVMEFTKVDLHTDAVSNHEMGTIFEYLIRKFKESSKEKAGQFYTPREIVQLLVNLVFAHDTEELKQPGKLVSIYDPACGTGGMLTEAKDRLLTSVNSGLTVYAHGQELFEKTYAICKADVLMKGDEAENIKQGDSLADDKLVGKRFQYMLSNPPFGDKWANIESVIKDEAKLGYNGRFGAGLPDVTDGSLLFLQHMISKMHPDGSTIGVVFNGSPLFNGDAGSGWSGIRQWIIENDWLDCIIGLPKDLFYGTGIATYIWIVTNKKQRARLGKIQLINATGPQFKRKLPRSLGKKQYEISPQGVELITKLYMDFKEVEGLSLIFPHSEFAYTKVTVERPLRLTYLVTEDKLQLLKAHPDFIKIQEKKPSNSGALLDALIAQLDHPFRSENIFLDLIEKRLPFRFTKGMAKMLRAVFAQKDEDADIIFTEDVSPSYVQPQYPEWVPECDSELRDTENIPFNEDVVEFFNREVLPFAPDAWMDRSKDRIGYEINFTKYFYEYTPLRPAEEIAERIWQIETETEGLLKRILA